MDPGDVRPAIDWWEEGSELLDVVDGAKGAEFRVLLDDVEGGLVVEGDELAGVRVEDLDVESTCRALRRANGQLS